MAAGLTVDGKEGAKLRRMRVAGEREREREKAGRLLYVSDGSDPIKREQDRFSHT